MSALRFGKVYDPNEWVENDSPEPGYLWRIDCDRCRHSVSASTNTWAWLALDDHYRQAHAFVIPLNSTMTSRREPIARLPS